HARLQAPPAMRVAALHVEKERLHNDGTIGEAPAGRSTGGRLRIRHRLELDLRVARKRQEPLLVSAVRPELRVDRVRDQPGCRFVVLDGGEKSGFAQLAREVVGRGRLRDRDEAVDLPTHEVEEVQFAGVVLAEADNATRRRAQFLVPGDLLAVVPKGPETTRVEVAVNVGADEVLQALAVVDESSRQRTEV